MSDESTRPFGPKPADHPSVGRPCPACKEPFAAGDFTTLVALGPGPDPEERRKALDGRAYNAVAVEVHWACATGDESKEQQMSDTNPSVHWRLPENKIPYMELTLAQREELRRWCTLHDLNYRFVPFDPEITLEDDGWHVTMYAERDGRSYAFGGEIAMVTVVRPWRCDLEWPTYDGGAQMPRQPATTALEPSTRPGEGEPDRRGGGRAVTVWFRRLCCHVLGHTPIGHQISGGWPQATFTITSQCARCGSEFSFTIPSSFRA